MSSYSESVPSNSNTSSRYCIFSKWSRNDSYTYVISRILQTILPKTWFCCLSRLSILIRCALQPKKYTYWTKLTDGIYVGAMPLKDKGHLEAISKFAQAVLYICEDLEIKPPSSQIGKAIFGVPVKPEEWRCNGIYFQQKKSPDLEPIPLKILKEAVTFVVQTVLEEKKTVYINCSGGRGRGAIVAIASMVIIYKSELARVIQYVENARPQVTLSQLQRDCLSNFCGSRASPISSSNARHPLFV